MEITIYKLAVFLAVMLAAVLLSVSIFSCQSLKMEVPTEACSSSYTINTNHPKAEKLQEKLEEMVALDIPGAVIAIKDGSGIWAAAAGWAKTENSVPMEICHLQFGQSVAKTYMATAMLLLYQEGKIDLDETIATYLPDTLIKHIDNTQQATVRMLLNHTSGIAEYTSQPDFIDFYLHNPLHQFEPMEFLNYIRHKPAYFKPSEGYKYVNSNYLLLALIADEITGDHKKYIQEEILEKHGFNHTFYHTAGFMELPKLVNGYWHTYGNGKVENCSKMHRALVGTSIGDDGIIATPLDYLSFVEKLMTNQILSEATTTEMLSFIQKNPNEPNGSGLGVHQTFYDGKPEIGHTGAGVGASCALGYFPDSDTYYFIGYNLGTAYKPAFEKDYKKIRNEVFKLLLLNPYRK